MLTFSALFQIPWNSLSFWLLLEDTLSLFALVKIFSYAGFRERISIFSAGNPYIKWTKTGILFYSHNTS